jgi:hypothetical protein
MKNKIYLLAPHSFLDVITNSSSELFIGDNTKSIDFIKEVLQSFLNSVGMIDGKIEQIYNIMTVEFIDEHNVDDCIESMLNYDHIPYHLNLETYEEPNYNSIKDFAKWRHSRELYRNNWKERNFQKLKDALIGKIMIKSNDDNSIPSDLFDIIEYRLLTNSERIHLG